MSDLVFTTGAKTSFLNIRYLTRGIRTTKETRVAVKAEVKYYIPKYHDSGYVQLGNVGNVQFGNVEFGDVALSNVKLLGCVVQ